MPTANANPNPGAPSPMPERAVIFYDGHCGLCHRWVKFVAPRDPGGRRFMFAPLQGEFIKSQLSPEQIAALPDSIVLYDAGELRIRSDAVLSILSRLGGIWKLFAGLGRVVPRFLRDWAYDRVASVRHRFFRRPEEACPIMPPELRARFEF
ncbi:MAG: DCC1-like thiol-disulfide oxidoreductase family protein [Planctomycetota bacterium]